MTIAAFRKLALSFPNSEELPHFEKTSFRVNKKIFATLSEKDNLVCLMLSVEDQFDFCQFDKSVIYPVPNKWGLKGATYVDLKKVNKEVLIDALTAAYNNKVKQNLDFKD